MLTSGLVVRRRRSHRHTHRRNQYRSHHRSHHHSHHHSQRRSLILYLVDSVIIAISPSAGARHLMLGLLGVTLTTPAWGVPGAKPKAANVELAAENGATLQARVSCSPRYLVLKFKIALILEETS